MPQLVYLYHGPYELYGITKHRIERLEGIIASLKAEGISVVLMASQIKKMVEMRIHNQVIFRCEITKLHFGGDGQLDQTTKAAVSAAKNHFKIYVGH